MSSSLERLRSLTVAGLGLALLSCALAMALNATLAAAAAVSLILTLSAVLGALRPEGLGPFGPWFVAALGAWLLAFAGMHWLPSDTQTLVLGLPPATAAAVYLLWPAPLLLVTLPYCLYFERAVLKPADLDSLQPYVDAATAAELQRLQTQVKQRS